MIIVQTPSRAASNPRQVNAAARAMRGDADDRRRDYHLAPRRRRSRIGRRLGAGRDSRDSRDGAAAVDTWLDGLQVVRGVRTRDGLAVTALRGRADDEAAQEAVRRQAAVWALLAPPGPAGPPVGVAAFYGYQLAPGERTRLEPPTAGVAASLHC